MEKVSVLVEFLREFHDSTTTISAIIVQKVETLFSTIIILIELNGARVESWASCSPCVREKCRKLRWIFHEHSLPSTVFSFSTINNSWNVLPPHFASFSSSHTSFPPSWFHKLKVVLKLPKDNLVQSFQHLKRVPTSSRAEEAKQRWEITLRRFSSSVCLRMMKNKIYNEEIEMRKMKESRSECGKRQKWNEMTRECFACFWRNENDVMKLTKFYPKNTRENAFAPLIHSQCVLYERTSSTSRELWGRFFGISKSYTTPSTMQQCHLLLFVFCSSCCSVFWEGNENIIKSNVLVCCFPRARMDFSVCTGRHPSSLPPHASSGGPLESFSNSRRNGKISPDNNQGSFSFFFSKIPNSESQLFSIFLFFSTPHPMRYHWCRMLKAENI